MSTKEKITFENAEGQKLSAELQLPEDGTPAAYAVFAHCFTCTKNLRAVGVISRALTAEGYGVLRFDFTGLGASEGEFEETNFSSNVSDLVSAAKFLEEHYSAPSLMVGHSLGGTATIRAAAKLDSVAAVATIGSPYDPEHVTHIFEDNLDTIVEKGQAEVNIGGRPFTVKRQFIEDLRESSTADVLKSLRKALLVFHSPVDRIVGVENAAEIFKVARHPKSFMTLDQADHLLSDVEDATYVGRVIGAWAQKYIDKSDGAGASERPKEDTRSNGSYDDDEVVAELMERFETKIRSRGFVLTADEPKSVGGTEKGPKPFDFVLAGLGACTAMTLRMYAERKEWPLEDVSVRLVREKEKEKGSDGKPRMVNHIRGKVSVSGDLDEKQRDRLLQIAGRCPVHRSLTGEIRISTETA